MLNKLYEVMYRLTGIRRSIDLISPVLHPLDKLIFPRNALWHYLDSSPDLTLLTQNHPLIANLGKSYIYHVLSVKNVPGKPIIHDTGISSSILKFQNNNKNFIRILDESKELPDTRLMIVNHEYIKPKYTYTKQVMKSVFETELKLNSLIDQIKNNISSNRHQFIFVEVPKVLPNVVQLFQHLEKPTNITKLRYQEYNTALLVEIFKWIYPHSSEESIWSKIEYKDIGEVTLVLISDQNYTLLNMGLIANMSSELVEHRGITKGLLADTDTLLIKSRISTDKTYENQRLIKMLLVGLTRLHNSDIIEVDPDEVFIEDKKTDQIEFTEEDDEVEEEKIEAVIADTLSEVPDEEKNIQNDASIEDTINSWNTSFDEPELIDESPLNLDARLDLSLADGTIGSSKNKVIKETVAAWKEQLHPILNKPMSEVVDVKVADLTIDKEDNIRPLTGVFDSSMLESSLKQFDKAYINKVYRRHQAAMFDNLIKAGIVPSEYSIDLVESAIGKYEVHKLKLTPINGDSSVISFKLPYLEEDGTFTYNNTEYMMRKQKADLPIRKIKPDKVALASYYGKLFICRSDKVVDSPAHWYPKQLSRLVATDPERYFIEYRSVFDKSLTLPKQYAMLSKSIKRFIDRKEGKTFWFDYKTRNSLVDNEDLSSLETDGRVIIGSQKDPNTGKLLGLYYMETNGVITIKRGNEEEKVGSFAELVNLPYKKMPKEFTTMAILGVDVPTIIVLGDLLGIKKAFKYLNLKTKVIGLQEKTISYQNQIELVLKDAKIIYSGNDIVTALHLNALLKQSDLLKTISIRELDNRTIYLELIEGVGGTVRHLTEIRQLKDLFIDPITLNVLESINEPTTFIGLIKRSVEMLMNEYCPELQDGAHERIRGYERFNGMIYRELINSVRAFNRRKSKARLKMELNPVSIWTTITQDPTVKITEITNPVQNLKEQSMVTMSGVDGWSKESLSEETRIANKNRIGYISEATVDSGDVGINTYLSANPDFNTLLGLMTPVSERKLDPTKVFSTSALLAAGSNRDDPKRINFISIQDSHIVQAEGYHAAIVRTGYESVVPDRVGKMFCQTALMKGEVVSKDDYGIIVRYEDNTTVGVSLGKKYGRAEGKISPHVIVSDLVVGEKIEKGDVIAYNISFFEIDRLNPKRVILKASKYVMVAFMDILETNEDSSMLSKNLATSFTTKTVKVKSVQVSFDAILPNMVKVGDEVTPNTVLVYLKSGLTYDDGVFTETAREALEQQVNTSPRANVSGVITRIEVFYRGELNNMSNSLRKHAVAFNELLAKERTSVGKSVLTGQVTSDYRIANSELPENQCEIKFYIESTPDCGGGDKLSFGHQMKSIPGKVHQGSITTVSGREIDAVFSFRSPSNRIVNSVQDVGIFARTLEGIQNEFIRLAKL